MPAAYDRWLEPVLFRPYAEHVTRLVAARRPGAVLEVAAGTGAVTRRLVEDLPGAAVTATDLNPAMTDLGSRRAPGASWRPADALDLPFDDGSFDAVVCQFGIMFFPDKVRGMAEAARVLRPGGHFVFTTWEGLERNELAATLVAALEERYPDDPPRFVADVPHGYGDLAAVRADLDAAGLDVAAAETVELDARVDAMVDAARGFCLGTPIRTFVEGRGDDPELVAVAAGEFMTGRLGEGPRSTRMSAHVVEAVPRGH